MRKRGAVRDQMGETRRAKTAAAIDLAQRSFHGDRVTDHPGAALLSLDRSNAWALARLDAHGQAALVRRGEIAPGAPVEAAIVRIEEIDPTLNSVSHRAFAPARAAVARVDRAAPMAGVPILLKASLAYPGFPQTSCSRAKREVVADRAYPYAERLDAAGLIAVGMSTMPEFGLLTSGEAMLTGTTVNPWNAGRSAGGSSTGAAVAVAAGLVPLAHASDAAGSIRVPASNCGVVGFKPSRGWNVRARAHHLIDDLLCSDAMIGRSTRDVAWGAAIARPAAADLVVARRPLRIAVDLAGMAGDADADVAAAVERSAALCAALGHDVDAVTVPIDRHAVRQAIMTLWPYLGGEIVDFYAATRTEPLDELLEPWTLGLAARRRTVSPLQLAAAYAAIAAATRAVDDFHQRWDVVLSPVTRTAPPPVGMLSPERAFDKLWAALFDYIDYTPLHNLVGTPSISLPLGWASDGMPIGSMFSSGAGTDVMLLQLAADIEAAAPWRDAWPPGVSASRPAP